MPNHPFLNFYTQHQRKFNIFFPLTTPVPCGNCSRHLIFFFCVRSCHLAFPAPKWRGPHTVRMISFGSLLRPGVLPAFCCRSPCHAGIAPAASFFFSARSRDLAFPAPRWGDPRDIFWFPLRPGILPGLSWAFLGFSGFFWAPWALIWYHVVMYCAS